MASTLLAPARLRRAERIEETEQALRRAKGCDGQERQELLSYAITLKPRDQQILRDLRDNIDGTLAPAPELSRSA